MPKRSLAIAATLFATTMLAFAPLSSAKASNELTYTVEVDVANQITTVYRNADRSIVRQMICSTGVRDCTPQGTFKLEKTRESTDRQDWYYITKYRCYVKYATRIKGPILFHSIPYSDKSLDSIDVEALSQLGSQASHGCIRLRWQDAMWIARNCPDGTEVRIYTGVARKSSLRDRLLEQGYAASQGQSYQQFLSGSEDGDGFVTLGRGASGDQVLELQKALIELGYTDVEATGTYDKATIVAVMERQFESGSKVNGIADKSLYDAVLREAGMPVDDVPARPAATTEDGQDILKASGLGFDGL